jgi:hypothetical protein
MIKSRAAQPIGAVAFVFALAVILAACGGSTKTTAAPPSTTSTTTAGNAARAAALAAYRSCMQSHGVTLPAGAGLGFGGGARRNGTSTTTGTGVPATAPTTTIPPGVTEQQWQAAIAACSSTLPARGNLQNNPQFQLYYNCLQTYLTTHGGTTLPPLSQGGGAGLFGGRGGPGGTGDTSSTTANPTLAAAQAHCAPLRPTFGGGSTTTTTGP